MSWSKSKKTKLKSTWFVTARDQKDYWKHLPSLKCIQTQAKNLLYRSLFISNVVAVFVFFLNLSDA